jgi:DNA repair protein RecN (Recombination protein N)
MQRATTRQGLLSAVRIENLAIVDRTELVLGPGLTVLTGETGAGKSILVDALSLILGSRADTELVRSGASEAVVEALFVLPESEELLKRFESAGVSLDDRELVIRRTVGKNGRGRVTINGQMATVGMLSELVRGLVDVSGQHEHVSLLDADRHLSLVDAYGGLAELVREVAELHGEVLGLEAALEAIQLDESEKARREDFLRFQLEEIQALDPRPGEIEELEAERNRLVHAGKLAEVTRRAEARLYSQDGAIVEALGRIQTELVQLARLDGRLESLSSSAATALAELEDLAQQLGRYTRGVEHDPDRLEKVDDRLEALKKVAKKHGGTIAKVLEERARMEQELDALAHDEARRADLSSAIEEAEARRSDRAVALSAARGKAAKSLEKAVQNELASLSMAGTQVKIDLVPTEIGARGAERAEILFSPNPGEELKPLSKTASGGELSRVLLAFKHVLSDRDSVATYVFDEVDSGIGGAVADVLGRKLKEVSADRQILCITHLPQVAAYGDAHVAIRKEQSEGRTVSRTVALDEREIVEELARMLGGLEITDRTRQLAKEMRERARSHRAASEPPPKEDKKKKSNRPSARP